MLRRIKRADLFEFMIFKVRRMDKPELIEDTNFDQEPLAIKMEKKSAEKSAESAEKSANSKIGIIRKTSVGRQLNLDSNTCFLKKQEK